MPDEYLERLYARINASAYVPSSDTPTGGKVRVIMAKQVKLKKGQEFTFASLKGGAAASKYPWDEWFNGDLLMLERSEGTEDDKGTITDVTTKRDYEVKTDAMPAKLRTAARRRYKVVSISRVDADRNRLEDALIIQARNMTDEEKVEEDKLRAEEKEALKARKEQPSSNGQAGTEAPAPTANQTV